jgi:signal transduction histidine kinase
MRESIMNPKLIVEEKKAIILFLWLFNLLYISYDFFYYFLYPILTKNQKVGLPKDGLGYWIYILIIGLIPLSIYYIKKNNPYIVKYFYIAGYLVITFINDLLVYGGTAKHFEDGNIVEVLMLLYSPIFVNKKYLWAITGALIGKDIFFGFMLHDPGVLVPITIYAILTAIAYILVVRFNSYINSLTEVHEELRHKEKLAIVGQMATAIGHEIRNPLSSLKGFAQLQKEIYPNTNDYYPIMIQEIDRINSIVNDLMYLGKPKSVKFEKASIEEIIAYTISITFQQAERQSVLVETLIDNPIPLVDCDQKQLKQVFINLIKNAIEAMIEGGKILINIKTLEGKKVCITIEDEGPGVPEEIINNLGKPFFTTKLNGTGLGLMVTNQIIKDHNGEMKIESNLGKGTKVIVSLPLIQNK